jgi:maleate cis-trans isomerase
MRLGIILPEAGAVQSEWLRLDPWLREMGVRELTTAVELSPSDGRHDVNSLQDTADLKHLIPAAKALVQKNCDAVVWACTSGSFIGGYKMAQSQNRALEKATRLPATNTSLALAAAAQALAVNEVDVLSPYPQSVTEAFVEFLSEMGIVTVSLMSLDSPDGEASSKLNLSKVLSDFQKLHANRFRPILIPDTAIDSLDLVDKLEAETGRIVVTANQATLWQGMTLIGLANRVDRCGSLFRASRTPMPSASP